MTKTEAIRLLGGSVTLAARHIGVTHTAVCNWPEELTPKIADRVYAALWRIQHGVQRETNKQTVRAEG